jgi:hypothetical protein
MLVKVVLCSDGPADMGRQRFEGADVPAAPGTIRDDGQGHELAAHPVAKILHRVEATFHRAPSPAPFVCGVDYVVSCVRTRTHAQDYARHTCRMMALFDMITN